MQREKSEKKKKERRKEKERELVLKTQVQKKRSVISTPAGSNSPHHYLSVPYHLLSSFSADACPVSCSPKFLSLLFARFPLSVLLVSPCSSIGPILGDEKSRLRLVSHTFFFILCSTGLVRLFFFFLQLQLRAVPDKSLWPLEGKQTQWMCFSPQYYGKKHILTNPFLLCSCFPLRPLPVCGIHSKFHSQAC